MTLRTTSTFNPLFRRLAAVLTMVLLSGAFAQSVHLDLFTVTSATVSGKATEVLTPSTSLKPGTLAQYGVTVNTVKAVRNAGMRLAIPAGTTYVAGSATTSDTATPTFTVDGKAYSVRPMKTVTVTENGKQISREVPAEINEYRGVRWVLKNLAAGQEERLSLRVRVN